MLIWNLLNKCKTMAKQLSPKSYRQTTLLHTVKKVKTPFFHYFSVDIFFRMICFATFPDPERCPGFPFIYPVIPLQYVNVTFGRCAPLPNAYPDATFNYKSGADPNAQHWT